MDDYKALSDAFALEVGRAVMAASGVEATMGEIIVLTERTLEAGATVRRKGDWASSGERLASALRELSMQDAEVGAIADEYRDLLDARNHMVHGEWLLSPYPEFEHRTHKRGMSTTSRDADFSARAWDSPEAVARIWRRLYVLQDRLDDVVTRLMGIA